MTGYLIRRLLWLPPTLLGLSLICFALLHLAPGDPGELLLRQSGGPSSAQAAAEFKAEMGLDKPLLQRYRLWLGRAVRLDLGESFTTGEPVRDQILSRMPATIKLALTAFGLMLAATIPIGLLSALRPQGWLDQGSRLLAVVFASLPNYWFGLLLMFLFARYWHIFNIVGHDPARGHHPPRPDPGPGHDRGPEPPGPGTVFERALRGLHPDRPGQGAEPAAGLHPPRPKKRPGPLCSICGEPASAISWAAPSWWRRSLPGPGAARLAVDAVLNRGLPRGPGLRHSHGPHLRGGQPGRGPWATPSWTRGSGRAWWPGEK